MSDTPLIKNHAAFIWSIADPEVMAQARNNEFENFRLVFDRMFMGTVVGRMDDNEAIFKSVLDGEFQKTLVDLYAMRVYRRLREEGRS